MTNDRYRERREARIPGRRSTDTLCFDECPRYEKHELTEEQMIEIAKKAVDMAMVESQQAIGSFVIREGTGFFARLMFLFGAAAFALYAWAQSKGLHF